MDSEGFLHSNKQEISKKKLLRYNYQSACLSPILGGDGEQLLKPPLLNDASLAIVTGSLESRPFPQSEELQLLLMGHNFQMIKLFHFNYENDFQCFCVSFELSDFQTKTVVK